MEPESAPGYEDPEAGADHRLRNTAIKYMKKNDNKKNISPLLALILSLFQVQKVNISLYPSNPVLLYPSNPVLLYPSSPVPLYSSNLSSLIHPILYCLIIQFWPISKYDWRKLASKFLCANYKGFNLNILHNCVNASIFPCFVYIRVDAKFARKRAPMISNLGKEWMWWGWIQSRKGMDEVRMYQV